MKRICLGIVGAGRIGRMHTENIVRRIPAFEVKTVADPYVDETWAQRVGIPQVSTDPQTVMEDPEIEAVAIFAASSAHVALITEAAQHKKHIFCEKPIAFDPEELARVGKLVDEAGVRLMVGLNRRFDPSFMAVRQAVAEGKVGTPHIVRITNRDPKRPDPEFVKHSGGLFFDFNVHDFDMVRFATGDEIEEVYAAGKALVDPSLAELGDIDTALVTLKLKSGALCVIDASRETHYGYDQRIEVFGTGGSIETKNKAENEAVLTTTAGVLADKPLYSFVERYAEAYVLEMTAFARCLQDKTAPPVGIDEVRKAVVVAHAALKSLKENRPVRVEY